MTASSVNWKPYTRKANGEWLSGWHEDGVHVLRADGHPCAFVYVQVCRSDMESGVFAHGWHQWDDELGGTRDVGFIGFSLSAAINFCEKWLEENTTPAALK